MLQKSTVKKDFWGNLFFWLIVGPVSALAALPLLLIGAANILAKILLAAVIAAILAGIIAALTPFSFLPAFYCVMLAAVIFTTADLIANKSK